MRHPEVGRRLRRLLIKSLKGSLPGASKASKVVKMIKTGRNEQKVLKVVKTVQESFRVPTQAGGSSLFLAEMAETGEKRRNEQKVPNSGAERGGYRAPYRPGWVGDYTTLVPG